jgi:transcriptional regulator with XRE-family HTH domain
MLEVRKRRQMAQMEVCAIAKVSRPLLARVERGQWRGNMEEFARLAAWAGLASIDDLFVDKPTPMHTIFTFMEPGGTYYYSRNLRELGADEMQEHATQHVEDMASLAVPADGEVVMYVAFCDVPSCVSPHDHEPDWRFVMKGGLPVAERCS